MSRLGRVQLWQRSVHLQGARVRLPRQLRRQQRREPLSAEDRADGHREVDNDHLIHYQTADIAAAAAHHHLCALAV